MQEHTSLYTHINELKYIMNQLTGINTKIDEEDAKVKLLNSLSSNYHNIILH